jgi:hypothetical protein
MKQIKLFMFLLCATLANSVFAQVEPVPPISTQYVVTYTWTGAGANTNWTTAQNWSRIVNSTPAVGVVVPAFPIIATAGANTTATVNVVIPVVNSNRYPSLVTNGTNPQTRDLFTISDLDIAAGASLNLNGRTLVVNGTISGTGELIGSPTSSFTADGKNNINVFTDAVKHAGTFAGVSYTEPFTNYGGDLNGGTAPTITVGTNFIDPAVPASGYSFNAKAQPGGLYGIEPTAGNLKLSSKVELEDLVFTYNLVGANPVYNISAEFSVTDFDGTPMTFGKMVDEDLDPNTPALDVRNNSMDVKVTLADGSIHDFILGASGTVLGITAQQPIASVTVTTLVQVGAGLVFVGYPTVDNMKIGNRIPFGNVYFNQTGTGNQLLDFNANLAAGVGSVTIASPLKIVREINPASGNILSTPVGSPAGTANLTLLSSATGTAAVVAHTNAGSIEGNVNVERHFATGRNKQWRFIGFPYSSEVTVAGISGINFSTVTPTMMAFAEALTNGNYGNSGVRNTGYRPLGADGAIAPGDGLVAWIYDSNSGTETTGLISGQQVMKSSGTLNENGNPVTKTLTRSTFIPNAADRGWNLISNPFAATIDWDNPAIQKNNIDGTIYRWDPQAANWTTYNKPVGVNIPIVTGNTDNYIESGASFFVKAAAAGAPSVVFGQDAKLLLTPSVLNQFGKNGSKLDLAQETVSSTRKASILSGLRLKASGPGNPIPADAYIDFSAKDATPGFDSKYDAQHMGRTSGAAVAIRSEDKSNYVVQFDRPIAEAGKEKRYYPLTVTVPTAGKTQLDLAVEGNWNSLNTVYLIDKKEGKTIPLSGAKLNYEFTMNTTKEEDRFVLAINHVNVAEKSGITATDVRVMNNPVRADVIDAIIAHPTAKAKTYSVVNASGATVNKGSIQDNNSVQHRLGFGKSNANGVMYLRVDFENGDSKTVKFIKL